VLNSASKIDAVNYEGTILTQKFTPSVLQEETAVRKMISLIKSFFDRYGYQIQLNIIDPQVLLDAKAHPEKYADLIVRVSGFNARFVELAPQVQDEFIARTQQMF
jgi:formate C-acetyltransferase